MDDAALARFFAALDGVEPLQAHVMRQVWDEEDVVARREAWQEGQAALRRAGRVRELDAVRGRVAAWGNETTAFAAVLVQSGQPGTQEKDRMAARHAALPAVMDAALAILAGDDLDQDQRYALTKPWRAALSGSWARPARHAPRRRPSSPAS